MLDFLIHHASAADYQLLTPLPGIVTRTEVVNGVTQYFSDFSTYIPALVKLVIGLAGGFAVLRIIMGGFLYVSTDAFGKKSEAKETIQNALIGLLLAMSAYVILYTLNPKLVDIGFTLQGVGSSSPLSSNLGSIKCSASSPCTEGVALTCGASNCNSVDVRTCTTASPCYTGTLKCKDCQYVRDNDTTFPHKKTTDNPAGCAPPGPCQVHETMYDFLERLTIKTNTGTQQVGWRVTEMYPSTVAHIDPCHNNGTCVDMAITGVINNTYFSRIKLLLQGIEAAGADTGTDYSYEYEICPEARRLAFLESVKSDPYLKDHANRFKCESTTTADNLHLEITP